MQLSYHLVDVFTQKALEGNALAVFPDGRNLDDATMQDIAREMNLSETSFVLPSTRDACAARVRIFTPNYEMEFAGHPTIGTSFVMQQEGLVPRGETAFTLEENVGGVHVRIEAGADPLIWLQTPAITTGERYDRATCAAALGLNESDLLPEVPCELWTAGNPNIFVAVRDASVVDRAWIDVTKFRVLNPQKDAKNCIFVFAPTPKGAYSRMFAPEHGIVEDPATGSATGPLAAFMMKYGLAPRSDGTRFVSEQGTKMKRRSFLHVLVHGDGGADGIEVGGHVSAVARATMTLDRR
jgi:trans-2,3-dihydro-3-hydroxyanthranilate isomerase